MNDEENDNTDLSVRRAGGKSFVDEERLNQFGRELTKTITNEIQKLSGSKGKNRDWIKNAECFYCHEIGHLKNRCPKKNRETVSQNAEDSDEY